jgi:uncharacterized protein YjbJ (UPF0337 family)
MSNGTEHAKAKAEELSGAIKEGVGDLIGNQPLQDAGATEKHVGQARQEALRAEERVKGMVEEIEGKAEAAVGSLVGNTKMRIEGAAKAKKGRGRRNGKR